MTFPLLQPVVILGRVDVQELPYGYWSAIGHTDVMDSNLDAAMAERNLSLNNNPVIYGVFLSRLGDCCCRDARGSLYIAFDVTHYWNGSGQ
jgi:hypothetical protein